MNMKLIHHRRISTKLYHQFFSATIVVVIFAILFLTSTFYNGSTFLKQQQAYQRPIDGLFYNTKRHNVDCRAILRGDASVDQKPKAFLAETPYQLFAEVYTNCSKLKSRNFYPQKPLSALEKSFPLAYAISVYDKLPQLELLINAIYAPQNFYCLHVDLKSSQLFDRAVRRFASCFPNIKVVEHNYPVDSNGMNFMRASMSCWNLLANWPGADWKYLFNIVGDDFPLRTNLEIVQIMKLVESTNVIELNFAQKDFRYQLIVDHGQISADGFPQSVVRNTFLSDKLPPPFKGLKLYRGSVSVGLTVAFVRYAVGHKKPARLLKWLDRLLDSDELFPSTLNHDSATFPETPGRYPGKCFGKVPRDHFVRHVNWAIEKLPCGGYWRHDVCVAGPGDLPSLRYRPELFHNKFDFARYPETVYCMHELIFNRTYGSIWEGEDYAFDLAAYENRSIAKFKRWKDVNPNRPIDEYDCGK